MSTIQPSRRSSTTGPLLVAWMLVVTGGLTTAQETAEDPVVGVIKQGAQEDRSFEGIKVVDSRTSVDLMERFSKDLEFRERLLRVDGHDPEVISVIPLGATGLRIRGLTQGVTTMVCTGETGQKYAIEIYVGGDARLLQSVLKRAFPGSAIDCRALAGGAILLTGYVTDNQTISQIMEVAAVYSPQVINHMRVGGPQEVQLRVKIMEVQRSKLRTFGVNLQAMTKSAVIASAPGSVAPITSLINPIGGPPSASMQPSSANPLSLATGFSNNQFAFNLFVQALKEEGLLKVMSEPVLVSRSGEAARLSDGGEFPIPVPGGLGTVTIEFREFGVILEMLPIVISPTRVKQQVTAEVSDKDTANSITLQGTTVPGLTKRRVQSTVDMNFGDTMVVAGMINTRVFSDFQKTPLIGEFPGIGAFFSKKVSQQTETELVILITPEFGASLTPDQVPYGGPGLHTTAPTDREMYLHGHIEVPKVGPDCPDCQNHYIYEGGVGGHQAQGIYQGGSFSTGGGGGASGPVIAPSMRPSPSCAPSSNGLIVPPGADSPVLAPTPTPPLGDYSASRRGTKGSSWPSKVGIASKSKDKNAEKDKEEEKSAESSVVPAGFKRFQKTDPKSQSSSTKRRSDSRNEQ